MNKIMKHDGNDRPPNVSPNDIVTYKLRANPNHWYHPIKAGSGGKGELRWKKNKDVVVDGKTYEDINWITHYRIVAKA